EISGSAPLLDRLLGPLSLGALFLDELVCEVVLVNIRDVGHGLAADLLRGHELYVVEPDIGVETALRGDLAELTDAAGSRVVRGEGEEALVELVHRLVRVGNGHHPPQEIDPPVNVWPPLIYFHPPHSSARPPPS